MRIGLERRFRRVVSNRVLAAPIAVDRGGYFSKGDWLYVGGDLFQVWTIDNASLVLYVY